jgi:hypothetical protein
MTEEWWAIATLDPGDDKETYEALCPRSPSFVTASALPAPIRTLLDRIAAQGGYCMRGGDDVEVTRDGDLMRFACKYPQEYPA